MPAIAVTGAQRWSELSDIPTVAETYPGFEVNGAWLGWFGPKNMPPAITARLQQEIAKVLQVPALREAIEKGQAPDGREDQAAVAAVWVVDKTSHPHSIPSAA